MNGEPMDWIFGLVVYMTIMGVFVWRQKRFENSPEGRELAARAKLNEDMDDRMAHLDLYAQSTTHDNSDLVEGLGEKYQKEAEERELEISRRRFEDEVREKQRKRKRYGY